MQAANRHAIKNRRFASSVMQTPRIEGFLEKHGLISCRGPSKPYPRRSSPPSGRPSTRDSVLTPYTRSSVLRAKLAFLDEYHHVACCLYCIFVSTPSGSSKTQPTSCRTVRKSSVITLTSHRDKLWFSAPVQTGPGAHPASYTMGTGSFPGVKRQDRGADHPPTI